MQGGEHSQYLEGLVSWLLRKLLAGALNQESLTDPEN
jgi:hypothetical protein